MKEINLGQIYETLTFIAGFLTIIVTTLVGFKKIMAKQLEPIINKIDKLDVNQCICYLIDFLADVENGIKKDETQIKTAYKIYDHYVKDLHGNSYIHDKWIKLMK